MTWRSSKKEIVADSRLESKYISPNEVEKDVMWLKKFINDLGVAPRIGEPVEIFCKKEGVIALTPSFSY